MWGYACGLHHGKAKIAFMTAHKPLLVVAQATQVLSPQQKKFNTLMQRIAKQRAVLGEWDVAMDLFRQRYASEMQPQLQMLFERKLQLVRLLDRLSEQKMPKADKAHLQDLICGDVDLLLEQMPEAPEDELKAIFERHAGMGYDEEQQAVEQEFEAQTRAMVQEMFGVELEEGEALTPEAVMQRLEQQAAAEEAGPRARARKPSAAALKKQEQAKLASQSVRDVFRKLASSLHPDREPDPAERERKNALMQRVNQAYEAGNLLQLLELQLEIEQIDAAHMASLSEERLSHYNQVLKEQLDELKFEVDMREAEAANALGGSPFARYTPKKVTAALTQDVAELRRENAMWQKLQEKLEQDPAWLKQWLKQDRARMRQQEQMLEDGLGFYF